MKNSVVRHSLSCWMFVICSSCSSQYICLAFIHTHTLINRPVCVCVCVCVCVRVCVYRHCTNGCGIAIHYGIYPLVCAVSAAAKLCVFHGLLGVVCTCTLLVAYHVEACVLVGVLHRTSACVVLAVAVLNVGTGSAFCLRPSAPILHLSLIPGIIALSSKGEYHNNCSTHSKVTAS